MKKFGKAHFLDFSDDEIKKLKECFQSLDENMSGDIGVEELEPPLIGLGFVDTREDVQELLDAVDLDGSGQIEFDEFLIIIKSADGDERTSKINKFFKDLSGGMVSEEQKSLSFN
jgi:centrin-2